MKRKIINKRNSNIELLRIFAMLMIIAFHIWCHCINLQLTDLQMIRERANGWFCNPVFFKRLLALVVIAPMGQVGNAIFIIISGYFMAGKGNGIDLSKIAKKLLLQLGFSTFVLSVLSIIIYNIVTRNLIKLVDFDSFNNWSWFVGYYFVVIVLAKVFLNGFLDNLNKKNYTMFLLVIFALIQFTWSRNILTDLTNGLEVLFTGVFLYSLGGYVKKYNPFEKIRTEAIIVLIIGVNLIICGNYYIVTINNILNFNYEDGAAFIQSIPEYFNYQFVPIVLGISVFELFRRMKLSYNKVINYLGASTFMIYLFHDNEFFYKIWDMQDWITLLHENVFRFIIVYIIYIVATFGISAIVYMFFELMRKGLKVCRKVIIRKEINVEEA